MSIAHLTAPSSYHYMMPQLALTLAAVSREKKVRAFCHHTQTHTYQPLHSCKATSYSVCTRSLEWWGACVPSGKGASHRTSFCRPRLRAPLGDIRTRSRSTHKAPKATHPHTATT